MSTDDWGPPRPALGADRDADVVIVGGGYSGLWTAYYLLIADPTLRVVVLEAAEVGFGASGRNGGWCSALLPMSLDAIERASSRDAAIRLQRAMHDTVAEVGRVSAIHGIDCDYALGGYVALARSAPQLERAHEVIADGRRFGFGDDDLRLLDVTEATALCAASAIRGATFTPHCASIHPAKLARGLARVVEQLGGTIYEDSAAIDISQGSVRCAHGTIRADVVVRATEAFTPRLEGLRRQTVPVYSLMIATEPLPADVWDAIGLADRPTFNDYRNTIVYGQRTACDRLAFGGRGAWYHWASDLDVRHERSQQIHGLLHDALRDMFPAVADAAITHRWGGAVAASRDLWCHTSFNHSTGQASLGNYMGDGVATTNLAGRTLADLILGLDTDRTRLPFVNHASPRWEPEPFRFLGVNATVRLPLGADRYEERTGRRSRWRERLLARLTDHDG